MARTFSRAMDKLHDFVASRPGIRELAVVHSAAPGLAERLKEYL